ncbi:glutathione S-transferase family protein [Roseiarcus sp.]|uniref:glutathione S-transferase family protein n=1 Tax=Roseiarcus sp. TaxID=1969460 RepID=UPI003F9B10BD
MLVLRAAAPSPFARKVRIAAAVLELDDRIEISAADTGDPDDLLRKQNPLGKVPALILESGEVLYDSAVIVEYLDALAGGGQIIPADPATRFRSLTQQALADGIMDAAVLLRYESLWREPDERSEKWIVYQGDKISRALAAFEAAPPEELSDIGTIALACALGYLDLRFEGAWRADHPRLVAWLDLFSDATPSFEATRFRG